MSWTRAFILAIGLMIAAAAPAAAAPQGSGVCLDLLGVSGCGTSSAPAALATDGSVATLSTGLRSTSGLTNVLSLAGGIPINDGQVHTVGNAPAGSIFYGLTTLAQLAALQINGTRYFWWLTDNGQLTGPMCDGPGSSINCFTSTTNGLGLTDKDVPNIDIAYLAIEGALMTRRAYLPAILPTASNNTGYQVASARVLPLMMPITSEADGNNLVQMGRYVGDGPRSSVIFAAGPTASGFGYASDGTSVLGLLTCGNPYATPSNGLGRWAGNSAQCKSQLQGIGVWGDQAHASSYASAYRTDGLNLGARVNTTDVESSWFYHDIGITGDHSYYLRMHANGGLYGLYVTAPNPALKGDLAGADLAASGQIIASVLVDGGASFAGTWDGETYFNAGLYVFDGASNGCAPILGGAYFRTLLTEYMGLSIIEDEHNFNPSTKAYNDSAKCRGVSDMQTQNWLVSFSNPNITTGTGRRRRAIVDASSMSGTLRGITENGGTFEPIADDVGPAGVAIFNVITIGDAASGIGLTLEGELVHVFHSSMGNNGVSATGVATTNAGPGIGGATIPFFPSNTGGGALSGNLAEVIWRTPGGDAGTFYDWQAEGDIPTTSLYDMTEYLPGSYNVVVPSGYNAAMPATGTVQEAGLPSGSVVPVQTQGYGQAYAGYDYGNDGYSKKATGIGGRTLLVAGSGGTNGTYPITATGPCGQEPILNAVVSNGVLAAVTFGRDGINCTGAPTFAIPASTGLSGASITPQWPAATIMPSSGWSDGPITGRGMHDDSGSQPQGGDFSYQKFMGMQ